MSIKEIITSNEPAIAKLNKEHPEELFNALIALITDLQTFFNVGKGMDLDQIQETAKLVTTEFYFLKLQDLQLAFKNMKAGKYGQLFDRFDGQILCLWLTEYSNNRVEVAETLKLEQHKTEKESASELKYFVTVGPEFIRETDDAFETTPKKEFATLFSQNDAFKLKSRLIKEHYRETPGLVNVKFNKPEHGLIKHLIDNRPDLVQPKILFTEKTKGYYEKVKQIEADNSLSDYQKDAAKRELAGLKPITEIEFNKREELMIKESISDIKKSSKKKTK